MEDYVDRPADRKLSGYLFVVVEVPRDTYIPINSICSLSGNLRDTYFVVGSDVRLIPISRLESSDSELAPSGKKLQNVMGMVNGSISVVHQLHALVVHKCLDIVARVVKLSARGDKAVAVGGSKEFRAVVLVDVYLPVTMWSGWQFPRSKATAASLFRHLSCNWESRCLMLKSFKLDLDDYYSIWNVADCHTLCCGRHCKVFRNLKRKKLFELQEIFGSLSIKKVDYGHVSPMDMSPESGISVLSDDILIKILNILRPIDLVQISSTCRHLRYLAASIMPCMKLKLYPHQLTAVEWMLQREKECRVLQHPLYINFKTEDGFDFNVNMVSGEIVTDVVPVVRDFRGGLFCDEPGLGKTITTLSLILKRQGTLAEPPDGVRVIWCMHEGERKCGYYEVSADDITKDKVPNISHMGDHRVRRGQLSLQELTPNEICSEKAPKSSRRLCSPEDTLVFSDSSSNKLCTPIRSTTAVLMTKCKNRGNAQRNLLDSFKGSSSYSEECSMKKKHTSKDSKPNFLSNKVGVSHGISHKRKRNRQSVIDDVEYNETWVQCDACGKWRKVMDECTKNTSTAWFCIMNNNPSYRSCNAPEEPWDQTEPITHLLGFHSKGSPGGQPENISFFISVLKENSALITCETKKALTWLAKLSTDKLEEMETIGLKNPVIGNSLFDTRVSRGYHKIFLALGLVKRVEKGGLKWYYPPNLLNLAFDLDSLRIALCEPLNSLRLYLSSATLIVVPSNLVDHWETQIERHVRPGQLRIYIWSDQKKKPSAHNLAWDYDVVITTFSRLSAEWKPHRRSVLMQVHWLRLVLDEGHTLGSSLILTNKLQMATSLTATTRWLLTGTPTPNTPSSQLSCLHPMLRFLKEEAYGLHQKSWEAGILRPYEAEVEEARSRLLQLLNRCMICSRKIDLKAIPPCIKKVTFLDFSGEHARSYNELVETVRRNILLADWNDPAHVESLLNQKQWKFRAATIRNVRLSCCVAGHVRVMDAGQDIQETMDILVQNGLDPLSEEHVRIKYNLLSGGNCMRCREWCRLPVITPCRHFLCLDCVALDSERCTFHGCGHSYEMQSPKELARPENPNPKWPVPKDLIELQPSYKQDDWNPDWQSTSSSKVSYLVSRLKQLQETNSIIHPLNGNVTVPSELNHFYWSDESNVSLGQEVSYKSRNERSKIPDKVIIFSQFLEHIHIIEQQLNISGIQFVGLYSPMHAGNKMKSLTSFQHDANCMALLMDGSAALGLDLSFVTHVYLMEPIWDRSVEEQVISRAHRMGATRPVHVETLAMNGTIEEQMLNFLQDGDGCGRLLKEFDEKDRDGARSFRTLHDFAESNYLAHLSFVRANARMEKAQTFC